MYEIIKTPSKRSLQRVSPCHTLTSHACDTSRKARQERHVHVPLPRGRGTGVLAARTRSASGSVEKKSAYATTGTLDHTTARAAPDVDTLDCFNWVSFAANWLTKKSAVEVTDVEPSEGMWMIRCRDRVYTQHIVSGFASYNSRWLVRMLLQPKNLCCLASVSRLSSQYRLM